MHFRLGTAGVGVEDRMAAVDLDLSALTTRDPHQISAFH